MPIRCSKCRADIRRRTLIAQREMRRAAPVYTFDIYLQGDGETVFFDV